MDVIINFLIDWGYVGMFLSAFLAGSVFPFSSEVVLAGLVYPGTGLNPVACVAAATLGNALGGMTCYWLGHLGKMEWLEKYFHVKREKIEKAQAWLQNRGAYMAFFAFLPLLGTALTVALGYMRANAYIVAISMFVGKLLRYILVVLAALGLFTFF